MGTGYTRNDTANNIADGNVINASDLDGEFDAVQAAFNGTTGHSHDGTTGEGPQIAAGGIANNAVTTAKILDANVTLAKMAANSVDSDQYVDGSIDRVHLAADIIDGTKIADDSINSEHYVDGSIDTAHIGNLQVTNAKIAADAIDGTKLADNAVDSEHYTDGSIDRVHLAADIVDGTKIADDSINSEHYVDGSIDTAHIANDAVTLGTKTSGNYVAAGATSGTGISGSVSSEGGTFTVTSNATNANTAGTIVARDGSGNFSAGTITANLTGTASNAALLDNVDSSQFLRSDAADTKTSGTLNFSDNVLCTFGASNDLVLYHDAANSYIDQFGVGDLYIRQRVDDRDIFIQSDNGGGDEATYIHCDGSTGAVAINYYGSTKLSTTNTGVSVTGNITVSGTVDGRDVASDGTKLDGIEANAKNDQTITAGNGLTGGGTGDVTLNVGAGTGIDVAADTISVDVSDFMSNGSNNRVVTATGADAMNAEANMTFDGSTLNVSGSAYITGNIGRDTTDYISFSDNAYMNIHINNSNEFRFEADGDFHADANVIAHSTTVSDERLKENIKKIENATDKVSQLNGYTFNYKKDGRKGAGVIAQEVEKVLPSAVMEKQLPLKMDDGVAYKIVEYDQIIGLLIESIKELKQEINTLKGE